MNFFPLRSRLFFLALYCCSLTHIASAEEPTEKIRLLDVHGQTYLSSVRSWSNDHWEIDQPDPQDIPMDQVVAVDWPSRKVAPLHRQPQILLTNGDRITLTIKSWDEEALTGTGPISEPEPLRIPLEFVRGIILQPLSDPRDLAHEMSSITAHPAGNDLITLSNGDQLRGQILRLENGSFQFERDSSNLTLAISQIRSLALNPELCVTPPNPPNGSATLTLTDGSSITLHDWRREEDRISGKLLGSIPLNLPLMTVTGLRPRSDRFQTLSELTPQSYRFTPFLASMQADAKQNLNPLGGPLLLDGRTIPHGLGLRSRSETTFSLDAKFKGFTATLGIDDAAENHGSALCQIIADGKILYTSPPLRGGVPPVQTPLIDLAGARQLTLLIDYGDEADVLDLVDVADAVLIR